MKWWMLLYTIGFFSPGVVFSTQTKASGPLQTTQTQIFNQLLSIPVAKERYDLCVEKEVAITDLDKCLWGPIADASGAVIVPDPGPAYREEISQALKSNNSNKGNDDIDIATSAVENLVKTKDPAYVKLQEFLEKRLRTALYNDLKSDIADEVGKDQNNETSYTVVGQEHFYSLFESQVSKNTIMTISSFCLQTRYEEYKEIDQATGEEVTKSRIVYVDSIKDPEKAQETIDNNIKRLANSSEFNIASVHYNTCLGSIPTLCNPSCKNSDPSQCWSEDEITKRKNKSDDNPQACMVLRSMRAARQQLLEISLVKRRLDQLAGKSTAEADKSIDKNFLKDAIAKGLATNEEEPSSAGLFDNSSLDDNKVQIREYDSMSKLGGVDRLTSMTTGELNSKENEFNATNAIIAEEFKNECMTDPSLEKCSAYLTTDIENQREKLAELSLRTQSLKELFSQYGDDENLVKKHLKDEGFTEDAINSMIASAGTTEALINQINEHYDNQRRALVNQVASLIESRKVDVNNLSSPDTQKNLENIHTELAERGNKFTKLLHYNNIMSGFLSVTERGSDGSTTERRNTEMIRREMANSVYSPEFQSRNPTSIPIGGAIYENTGFENLTQNLESNQMLEENSQGNSTVTLKLEDMNNKFLRYFEIQDSNQ